MKKSLAIIFYILFLLAPGFSLHGGSLTGKTICGCEDKGGFPPYTFQGKGGIVTGFSVEVLTEIFKEKSIEFSPRLLPWKRCLSYVEQGKKCQLIINATYSSQRALKYLFSKEFYLTTPGYFYSKKHYPDGLTITEKRDLTNYRIGKMLGYNYSEFGPEINEKVVKSNIYSNSYKTLVKHLHSGHCDLFLEKIEIIKSFKLAGQDLMADKYLGYAKVPGIKSTPFYILFNKSVEGLELKEIVDKGLEKMAESGRLAEIKKKYIPDGFHKPAAPGAE